MTNFNSFNSLTMKKLKQNHYNTLMPIIVYKTINIRNMLVIVLIIIYRKKMLLNVDNILFLKVNINVMADICSQGIKLY